LKLVEKLLNSHNQMFKMMRMRMIKRKRKVLRKKREMKKLRLL